VRERWLWKLWELPWIKIDRTRNILVCTERVKSEIWRGRVFSKYDCCKWVHLEIRGTIFWMFPRQPPARCSLYSVEKSIYRLPRSLLVVVLRSSRGESILRCDVEKRDVDVARDRENDSGKDERIKEKGESEEKDERVGYVMHLCLMSTYVCECTLQKAHTLYEARYVEPKMTYDLEIFADYVITNYRMSLTAFFAFFAMSRKAKSARWLCNMRLYVKILSDPKYKKTRKGDGERENKWKKTQSW